VIINTKIIANKIVNLIIKIYYPIWFLSMFMIFDFIEVNSFFEQLFKYLFLLPIIFGFLFLYGTFISLLFSSFIGIKSGYFIAYLTYIIFPVWYCIEKNLQVKMVVLLYIIPMILFDILIRHSDFGFIENENTKT